MQKRNLQFQSFYCYMDSLSGKKIISRKPLIQSQSLDYFYVAACPNEHVAKTVYDRHLAIAQF